MVRATDEGNFALPAFNNSANAGCNTFLYFSNS